MNTPIVRNWMMSHPITISPQTTLPEAKKLMLDYHLRRLPVVNEGQLVGIITWRDINRAETWDGVDLGGEALNSLLEGLTAKEFMSYVPITVSPETMIGEAASLMVQHKIGGLPVVEDGKLVGMITETDLCIFVMQLETVP